MCCISSENTQTVISLTFRLHNRAIETSVTSALKAFPSPDDTKLLETILSHGLVLSPVECSAFLRVVQELHHCGVGSEKVCRLSS